MLGENNYSSYQVTSEFKGQTFAPPSVRELYRPKVSFEQEFTVASELIDELRSRTSAIYGDIAAGKNVKLEELRSLIRQCSLSIDKNANVWLFLCQERPELPYMTEHALRTSIYAMCIGAASDFALWDQVELGLSALLCDIGKIRIPETILEKEGALTSVEHAVIRVHPLEGKKILLDQSDASAMLIEVVVSHHEYADGHGYPANLVGDEIPYFARIVAIAEAYDAMTTERVYASARKVHDAKSILWERKGKQFDATLVDHLLSLLGHMPVGYQVKDADGQVGVLLEPLQECSSTYRFLPLSPNADIQEVKFPDSNDESPTSNASAPALLPNAVYDRVRAQIISLGA